LIAAAQFSVHRSPSRSAARPFVVVLQSNDFNRMPTRVVAPLVLPSAMPRLDGEHPRIAPVLTVLGRGYILNPFDIATIAVARLGDFVGSFSSDQDAKHAIQDALDAILKPFGSYRVIC
jgi:mRNA-degrading endonuclease toxin of MazEF toxin-antitoxin module